MASFWRDFSNSFAQGMFNNMCGCFMPRFGCWSVGFNMGASVFGMPMMNFGAFYQSPGLFTMPMTYMSTPAAFSMPVTPFMPNYGTSSSSSNAFTGNIWQNWNTVSAAPQQNYQNWNYTTATPIQTPQKIDKKNSSSSSSTPVSEVTYDSKKLYEKWSKKYLHENAELTEEFCQKVIDISNRTKCSADDIMALIFHESRFNPRAGEETNSNFVGLIQFGEAARIDIKVPGKNNAEKRAAILNMSSIEQLDYVEKYIMKAKGNNGFKPDEQIGLGELAALGLFPKNAKQDVVINSHSSNKEERNAYRANKPLDLNNDGIIKKDELIERIKRAK